MIEEGFSYKFTVEEAKDLALLMRKYEDSIPDSLNNFSETIESLLYNSMSIDEAEEFFHGKSI
ncbi:MAG: hypothetical protein J6T84_00825 [Spirochaetaceae bacterium]|nr:hypothetical protein [Spirochaetaceae bacterium]